MEANPNSFKEIDIKSRDIRLAMLSIGNIQTSAIVSIKSFLTLNSANHVCLGANSLSTSLLSRSLTKKEYDRLCLHDLSRDLRNYAKLDYLNEYQNYHSKSFARITLGKWLLIKRVFREHSCKFILFSDLDVFWTNQHQLILQKAPNVQVLTQDGYYPPKGDWYCTGIMVWQKTEKTLEMLDALINTQIRSFEGGGEDCNDEIAFNQLFLKPREIAQISTLPRYQYMVGYHVLNLRIIKSKRLLKNCFAFHANSVEGEELKLQLLQTAVSSKGSLVIYLFQHIKLIYKIVKKRIYKIVKKRSLKSKITEFPKMLDHKNRVQD